MWAWESTPYRRNRHGLQAKEEETAGGRETIRQERKGEKSKRSIYWFKVKRKEFVKRVAAQMYSFESRGFIILSSHFSLIPLKHKTAKGHCDAPEFEKHSFIVLHASFRFWRKVSGLLLDHKLNCFIFVLDFHVYSDGISCDRLPQSRGRSKSMRGFSMFVDKNCNFFNYLSGKSLHLLGVLLFIK